MNLDLNKKKSILIQLIFWILFFLLANRITGAGSQDVFGNFIKSIIIILLFAGVSYLNILVLTPKLLTNKRYIAYIFVILLILVLIPTLFVKFDLFQLLHEKENFISEQDHRPPSRVNPILPKFILILLATCVFLFTSTIIRLIFDSLKKDKQKLQIEKERLLIETKYLRTQLSPHFFLNALNNLQSVIRLSPKQSEKYINTLAQMMRYITYDCKNNLVPISKEIAYISNYIYFQQIKDDELSISFQIDFDNTEIQIEPMLLMPFVENAFKYGSFDDAKLHPITISISQQEGAIYFSCENNINPRIENKNDPSYSGLGIENVKARLNASYPNKHELQIINNGTDFIVDLKLG